MSLIKNCKNCQVEKPISDFYEQKSGDKIYKNNICIECTRKKQKEYRDNNKSNKKKKDKEYYEKIKLTSKYKKASQKYRNNKKSHKQKYDKNYRKNNKEEYKLYCIENAEKISEVRHDYYLKHKEDRKKYNKEWYANNKDKKHAINTKYFLKRLKKDISFKLRYSVSRTINTNLKLINSNKNGNSILNFLSYSINELKSHLENIFEPWMTWENWGLYNKNTWNDNDCSTWTWQLDHIVPQSKLVYSSMEDDNFKKCWALENLRPYSAKQNILDGNRR